MILIIILRDINFVCTTCKLYRAFDWVSGPGSAKAEMQNFKFNVYT